jgi:hypothetical protein
VTVQVVSAGVIVVLVVVVYVGVVIRRMETSLLWSSSFVELAMILPLSMF